MKSIKQGNFSNKKVLLRVDFNVSLKKDGNISEKGDWRLRFSLPTINYLLKQGAKIILLAHLGRPNGHVVEKLRLDKVAQRLEHILNHRVVKLNDCLGTKVENAIGKMKPGDIIFLENLRFHKEEEKNDLKFAKTLSRLGEVYVNDAFGTAHRKHASIVGLPKFLPAYVGLLLEKEIKTLSKVLNSPDRPLISILGGVKISTKIKLIDNFLKTAQGVVLGGALANMVIQAKGFAIGKSVVEKDMIEEVKKLELTDTKLHIPVDAVVSTDTSGTKLSHISPIGNTKKNEMILDIGPDTNKLFKNVLLQAKTIVWNGPMGYFEKPSFASGSVRIAKIVALSSAFTLVGGGDTITLLNRLNLTRKINHICSGGGAMLSFLAGEKLPGVEVLS